VSLNLLKSLNKLIPVLHPGPANIGVELDQALIKSSLYKGYLQVENSIPMRMAIIEAMLLNNDQNVGIINGEKLKLFRYKFFKSSTCSTGEIFKDDCIQ
jgi:aspartate carbamoyltransferase catalytic subunit